MEKYVIKRNGDYKPFESFKIEDAIAKSLELQFSQSYELEFEMD